MPHGTDAAEALVVSQRRAGGGRSDGQEEVTIEGGPGDCRQCHGGPAVCMHDLRSWHPSCYVALTASICEGTC